MTAAERDTIRVARDLDRRSKLLVTNAHVSRRDRLTAACAIGSTISRDRQARLVMRMLAERGVA